MHIPTLHPVVHHVIDSTENRSQHLGGREEHGGIQEGILEVRITVEKLLAEEGGIGDIFEEANVERVLREMGKDDSLHPWYRPASARTSVVLSGQNT